MYRYFDVSMAARSLLPPSCNPSVDKEKYELSTRVITAETSAVENEVQLQEAVSPWLLLCLRRCKHLELPALAAAAQEIG